MLNPFFVFVISSLVCAILIGEPDHKVLNLRDGDITIQQGQIILVDPTTYDVTIVTGTTNIK
jgi:hypothetical protein